MGDVHAIPVGREDIDGRKFAEQHLFGNVAHLEVGFTAVVEIAHIMKGELVTVLLNPGQLCHFRLPVSAIGWLDLAPEPVNGKDHGEERNSVHDWSEQKQQVQETDDCSAFHPPVANQQRRVAQNQCAPACKGEHKKVVGRFQ